MKNVMIAGGTGMIGRACTRLLKERKGYEVFAPKRAEVDLSDRYALLAFMKEKKITTVIFAAGRVGGIIANRDFPASFLDENAMLALNGMWAAKEANVERMVVFGSSCMYPVNGCQPFSEDSLFTGILEPTSLAYATAKLLTVQAAHAYNSQYPDGTLFIPVIPNSTYGPYDNFDSHSSHVMSALIAKFHHAKCAGHNEVRIWGSGTPKREFVFCDDVATACLTLLEEVSLDLSLPFNITSGQEVSIEELASLIASVVNYKGNVIYDASKPDGSARKALDGKRMRDIRWWAKTKLEYGVAKTYEWYVKNKLQKQASET